MLKIGDFSTLSKISIDMLRHYDKIDLLIPTRVDSCSGYRYYSECQLADANSIQSLKRMGLGLSTIKEILHQYGDSESLADYLSVQARIKHDEMESLQQQIHRLESTIAALHRNSNILGASIEVKKIPQRTVAFIRPRINEYPQESQLWKTLVDTLKAQHILSARLTYDMAIYHDEGFVENSIDVELQRTVAEKGNDTESVQFKQAPAILDAVLTYEGEYQQITEISEMIANWVQDNHYEFCGPHFNIYHNSPATEPDADKMVTEVGFPIQRI